MFFLIMKDENSIKIGEQYIPLGKIKLNIDRDSLMLT